MGTYYDIRFFFGKQEGGKKDFKNFSFLQEKTRRSCLLLLLSLGHNPGWSLLVRRIHCFSHPPIICLLFGPEEKFMGGCTVKGIQYISVDREWSKTTSKKFKVSNLSEIYKFFMFGNGKIWKRRCFYLSTRSINVKNFHDISVTIKLGITKFDH